MFWKLKTISNYSVLHSGDVNVRVGYCTTDVIVVRHSEMQNSDEWWHYVVYVFVRVVLLYHWRHCRSTLGDEWWHYVVYVFCWQSAPQLYGLQYIGSYLSHHIILFKSHFFYSPAHCFDDFSCKCLNSLFCISVTEFPLQLTDLLWKVPYFYYIFTCFSTFYQRTSVAFSRSSLK